MRRQSTYFNRGVTNGADNKRLLGGIVYGMIGGAIGTTLMERVANAMYKLESEETKEQEAVLYR